MMEYAMKEDSSNKDELFCWNEEKPSFLGEEFARDSDELRFLKALSYNPVATLIAAAIADRKHLTDLGIDSKLTLCYSQMLNASTNLLIGEINRETFVISQHVSSCDFIFFPKINRVKLFCHANIDMVVDVISQLKNITKAFEGKAYGSLGGLITSHGRPSHYFYDAILGLIEAVDYLETVSIGKKLHLYQIVHCNFADLEFFQSEKFQHTPKPFGYNELNSLSNSTDQLFLKIGSFYDRGNDVKRKKLAYYDEIFLKNSTLDKTVTYQNILKLKSAGYLVLWHGITTQKRRWIEQCESIINLGKILCDNGVKLCVVVDGWTCPLTPSTLDEKQIASDNVAFSEISEGLPATVHTVNVIGKPPAEKLSIASLVDFHITNGGTGSIYTSRMAKIPGILHISNKAKGMTEQSIHYNSIFVPETLVTDIEVEGQRDDFVSYSIAKKSFSDFALNEISSLFDIKINAISVDYSVNCKYIADIDLYESYNDDPIIIFNKANFFSELEGAYEIKIQINSPLKYSSLDPKLYIDLGDGYSEESARTEKYNERGEVSFHLNFRKNLKSLRFDPFSCEGRFTINYAIIKSNLKNVN